MTREDVLALIATEEALLLLIERHNRHSGISHDSSGTYYAGVVEAMRTRVSMLESVVANNDRWDLWPAAHLQNQGNPSAGKGVEG
jgi:hypothetical protein